MHGARRQLLEFVMRGKPMGEFSTRVVRPFAQRVDSTAPATPLSANATSCVLRASDHDRGNRIQQLMPLAHYTGRRGAQRPAAVSL